MGQYFLTRKMVIFTCAIKSCRRKGTFGDGNSTRNSGFFRFPGHPRIREIWYKNTGIKPEDINTCTRICEIHFVESDFCRTLETKVIGKTLRFEKKRLKFSAAPTLHLDKTKLPKLLQNVKQEIMEQPKVTLDQKLKKLKRQIDEDESLARYKDILLKKKFGIDKEVKIVLDRIGLEKVEEPFKENRKKYDYENYGLKIPVTKWKYDPKYKYDPKRVYDPSRPLKCRYCGLGYKRDSSLRFCETMFKRSSKNNQFQS